MSVTEIQDDRIVADMVKLARCFKHHRIIVAGTRAAQQMFDLHRLGYHRVATTTSCGQPHEQYDVAFVDWRERPLTSLPSTLDWVDSFLSPAGVLILTGDRCHAGEYGDVRSMLKKLGFYVEAGTLSGRGLALAARRIDSRRSGFAA